MLFYQPKLPSFDQQRRRLQQAISQHSSIHLHVLADKQDQSGGCRQYLVNDDTVSILAMGLDET